MLLNHDKALGQNFQKYNPKMGVPEFLFRCLKSVAGFFKSVEYPASPIDYQEWLDAL